MLVGPPIIAQPDFESTTAPIPVPNPLYACSLVSTGFTTVLPIASLGAKTLGDKYLILTVGGDTIEIYYKLHTTNTTASVEAISSTIISIHPLLCNSSTFISESILSQHFTSCSQLLISHSLPYWLFEYSCLSTVSTLIQTLLS